MAFDKGEEPEKNRLPQDNLKQEIREMRRKNPLKLVNTPSASAALKKSGAVRIVHASVHEPPKKQEDTLLKKRKPWKKGKELLTRRRTGEESSPSR